MSPLTIVLTDQPFCIWSKGLPSYPSRSLSRLGKKETVRVSRGKQASHGGRGIKSPPLWPACSFPGWLPPLWWQFCPLLYEASLLPSSSCPGAGMRPQVGAVLGEEELFSFTITVGSTDQGCWQLTHPLAPLAAAFTTRPTSSARQWPCH